MNWHNLYQTLTSRFEIGDWWPAESDFEFIIGAILTQNTSWTGVQIAIDHLRQAQMLSPSRIVACEDEALIELIKPAGSYNRKARSLRHASAWVRENHVAAQYWDTPQLRTSLMAVHGIGPETADDILLYVYKRPVFIYDLYARRMFDHLGLPVGKDYEQTRALNDKSVQQAAFTHEEHAHFHGLIVEAGKYARGHGWSAVFSEN